MQLQMKAKMQSDVTKPLGKPFQIGKLKPKKSAII